MSEQRVNSILSDADTNLSTLNYAVALQIIAAKVGFDWPDVNSVFDKIQEEIAEVIAEINVPNNHHRLEDEIGDLLFICTNLARHLNIDPEQALQASNSKFYRRFSQIEAIAKTKAKNLPDYSVDELNQLWQQVKSQE